MSNHTPGPWEVVAETPTTVKTPNGRISVNWNANNDGGKRVDEAEANARLIAAAPKMYSLLAIIAKQGSLDAATLIQEIENE